MALGLGIGDWLGSEQNTRTSKSSSLEVLAVCLCGTLDALGNSLEVAFHSRQQSGQSVVWLVSLGGSGLCGSDNTLVCSAFTDTAFLFASPKCVELDDVVGLSGDLGIVSLKQIGLD